MPGHLLNIRMHKDLYEDAVVFSKDEGYSSVQDFARNALREKIRALKLERIKAEVMKLRGSAKGTRIASKKELAEFAKREYKP